MLVVFYGGQKKRHDGKDVSDSDMVWPPHWQDSLRDWGHTGMTRSRRINAIIM